MSCAFCNNQQVMYCIDNKELCAKCFLENQEVMIEETHRYDAYGRLKK